MKLRKIVFNVSLLLLVFAIFILIQSFLLQNKVIATVNDEVIQYKDVQKIYSQLDEEETPTMVLDSLIDELVVVTFAEEAGVSVTDEEVDSLMEDYKTIFPEIYQEGKRIYGKEDFYEGIKWQLIYDKVYDIAVKSELEERGKELKETFCKEIKKEEDFVNGINEEKIFEKYYAEFEEYIFDSWLREKREQANIQVYDDMEDIK